MGKYFRTESEFYGHFKPFFESLITHPEVGRKLADNKMSFRFITKDPAAEIALDLREGDGVVRTGAEDGNEDVKISLRADLLHQLLLAKIRLMPAIMGRQISARGVMDKQRELGATIASLSQLYKEYLKDQQKENMID